MNRRLIWVPIVVFGAVCVGGLTIWLARGQSYVPPKVQCSIISENNAAETMLVEILITNVDRHEIVRTEVGISNEAGIGGRNDLSVDKNVAPNSTASYRIVMNLPLGLPRHARLECFPFRVTFLDGGVWKRPYSGAPL
jgi:hypothetical protein